MTAAYRSNHGMASAGDVPHLPPGFGSNLSLDQMDMKLFKFCEIQCLFIEGRKTTDRLADLVAFCAGRTLLTTSNVWLNGLPAIAEKCECVRHAMLSLSAGYVLDYRPAENLKRRANFHHRRALMMLGVQLNDRNNYELGKEEPLLMALSLLNQEDIINWENRDATKHNPKWYQGAKAVKKLLEASDPGYHYQHPMNVQSTTNRYHMGLYQVKNLILSDTCAPLGAHIEETAFQWLLEGNEREVRRIAGLAGCCAKILHIFTQITRLCRQIRDSPESPAIIAAGKILLERLTNFQQWSDLAEAYATSEDLFEACRRNRDEEGKIKTAALSVALNGEAYVQCAQIYLLCRLFRRPRRHPEVQRRLSNLMKCTDWVPLEGPLFTAQDSLFGLLMAGLAAVDEEDRERLRTQFGPLETGPRGEDVLVCRVVDRLWTWLDANAIDSDIEEKPLKDRAAWWEVMTEHIFATEGRLNML